MRVSPRLPFLLLTLLPFSAIAQDTADTAKPADTKTAAEKEDAAQEKRPAAKADDTGAKKADAPTKLAEGWKLFGSLRVRPEVYNWFPTNAGNGAYSFTGGYLRVGATRQTPRNEFTLELTAPYLFNLPNQAVTPAPTGQLGHGGSYFAENGNRNASLFLRQGFLRFKEIAGSASSLKLGRFEFAEGVETTSADPTLNWLKQNRINSRLIGTFAFTDIQRSYDGVQFSKGTTRNLTALFALPTRGVFDLNGMDTLTDIKIGYLAATAPTSKGNGEFRLFGMFYGDTRGSRVIKTDNRPLATPVVPVGGGTGALSTRLVGRLDDRGSINIGTLGGNYERVLKMGGGNADFLFWGAGQFGNWGVLDHGAFAFDVEAGYQPKGVSWKPWFRVGYYYASGDGDNANNTHGTFFPMTPTPRLYARFPFFSETNLKDLFAQVILKPAARLTLRTDIHGLRLADSHDLWYGGGGAYNNSAFGYNGRTSSGHSNLATLADFSADYQLRKNTLLTFYFGYAFGGDVISSIYKDRNAGFGYVELNHKF